MRIDVAEFRRRFPTIAERADLEAVGALLDAVTVRNVGAGTTLISDGEYSETLYFVWEGKLSSYLEQGERLMLGEVPAGQWVGEVSVLDPGPATATVKSDTDAVVLVLSRTAFERLQAHQPRLASGLLRAINSLLIDRLRTSSTLLYEHLSPAHDISSEHGPDDNWLLEVYRGLVGHRKLAS